jgi:hypothetical protein
MLNRLMKGLKYSSSPVIEWLFLVGTLVVAVCGSLVILMVMGRLFHISVPFIMLSLCH